MKNLIFILSILYITLFLKGCNLCGKTKYANDVHLMDSSIDFLPTATKSIFVNESDTMNFISNGLEIFDTSVFKYLLF
jgi:hypothetical protein